jgi:hypothetical protein
MVIPGRAEGASPESITTASDYGFRARPFGPSRNDGRRDWRKSTRNRAGGAQKSLAPLPASNRWQRSAANPNDSGVPGCSGVEGPTLATSGLFWP